MAMNVGKELADLREMSVRELREKYETVFGEPTRVGNKDFLFKRIAWRIPALADPWGHAPESPFRPDDCQTGQLDVAG